MNTRISSQLTALAIALLMNTVLIGGMGYIFSVQGKHESPTVLLERTAASAHEVV